MPPIRRLSTRDARGRGWHKKGYRQRGQIFFQLKRVAHNFSREHEINENETVADLLDSMHRRMVNEEDSEMPDTLHFTFFLRRQQIEDSSDLVKTILDGGETVYAKVLDDEGEEWVNYAFEWIPKKSLREVRSRIGDGPDLSRTRNIASFFLAAELARWG